MYLRKRYETETWIEWFWDHVLWCLGRRQLTFWWQRRTRGFDDSELWSLDFTMCKFMAPRIRALAAMTHGCPSDVLYGEDTSVDGIFAFDALPEEEQRRRNDEAFARWKEMLSKMARAMELYVEHETSIEFDETVKREWEEGMALFHKYLFALWD